MAKPNPTTPSPSLGTLGDAERSLRRATHDLRVAQASIAGAAASAALSEWKISPADASTGATMVGLKTDAGARAGARIEALKVALESAAARTDPAYRAQIEARLTKAIDGAPKAAVRDAAAAILGGAIERYIPKA